jgi:DNA-binding protein WhiA
MNRETRAMVHELATVPITPALPVAARKAETAALLRFGGGLRRHPEGRCVEAVLESSAAALRLRGEIVALHGLYASVVSLGPVYRVRVVRCADYLARRTGLLSPGGTVSGGMSLDSSTCTFAEGDAALRGAFMARGRLVAIGPSERPESHGHMRVELICPGPAVAQTVHGYLRRRGISARRAVVEQGRHRMEAVAVLKPRPIVELLVSMGAPAAARRFIDRERAAALRS